jgi:hypothetical protein
VVGEEWNPQILVNLPVTNVPRSVSSNANTLDCKTCSFRTWLQAADLQDRTCVTHHRTEELLVEQETVSDGQADSPVNEGAKHAQSLSRLLSYLVDMRRPGKPSIKGHPKIPCCLDPLYWLSEKLHCSGFFDASRGFNK